MRAIIFLLVLTNLLLFGIENNFSFRDKKIQFSKEELDWIKNNPVIKVGADENWPPFDYKDKNGNHRGIANKYLKFISKKTGLKFQVHTDKWKNIISKVKNNEIDMLGCVGEIEDRKEFLNFTRPYLNLDFVVIGRKDFKITSFDEIKKYKIAIRKKTYVYEKLLDKFKNLDFVFIEKNEDALKAVSSAKADIYVGNLAIVSHFFHNNLLDNLEIKLKADLKKARVCMASSKKNKILQQILDKSLASLSPSEHALIHKKWSFNNNIENVSTFNLSNRFNKEEIQWIQKNPIVKVGIDLDWPPFEFYDNKTKEFKGISSEYLKIISEKTGLKFEIDKSGWKSVISKIKEGHIDILSSAIELPNRKKFLNFTKPYLEVNNVIVGRKGKSLKKFDDLKNYKIAEFETSYIRTKLKNDFPNIKFVTISSYEEALTKIVNSEADFFIGKAPVIQYIIEKNFFTNLNIKMNLDMKKSNICIAVYKEKDILFNIIQKVLNEINSEKRKSINRKWIFESKLEKKQINFTKKERKWLLEHKTIKVGSDSTWAPYSYVLNNKYIGIFPDILKMIGEESGLNFKYIKTKTWADSINLIKEKKLDLLDAVANPNLREEYLSLSNKFLSSYKVIIGRNDEVKHLNSIDELEEFFPNKKFGLVTGYTISLKIEKDHPNLKNIVYFSSVSDLLKALSKGEIDFTVLNIPNFDFYTKKYGLSNLKILGATGYFNEYSFGVHKDNEELISILNKILKHIPKEKIDEIYRKWIKIEYEEKIDYSLAIKVIFIALLILFGTLYWNRKLKNEIEQKEKVQKDLQKSKDFINAIMNSQVDIVITTNGSELKQANQSFFEFTGFETLKDFKKKYNCICELFDTNNSDKYLIKEKDGILWLDRVLNNKDSIFKALIYKDKKPFIFKVTASNISKDLELKTVVFTDITELENLNEELKKAKDLAENVARQKSEFLANMSHEIRTPMNSVIGFTEILDKEITNPIHKDYLSSIKKGGNSLLRIINDILDLSKIEAGKLEIKKESINPANLFLEIESIFHSKIISKNIEFIVDIDESIPKYVILDGVRLRQILFNLIGNAIKFTEKGYIKLKVKNIYRDEIKSKVDLTFSVEDTGIGIDEKDLEKIFNAFEQQESQDVAKYGGTGLGLAICTKLIHLMNGKISVKSEKTKGSTFEVTLLNVPVSSIEEETIQEYTNYNNIIFERAQILVVDDVEENRELVKASLKDYDIQLTMAENGKVALEKLNNLSVDLVFLDLRMPVMNGYETIVELRKKANLKDVPVIALTASVMGKDLEKVKEYGFDGYLRKPVILQDLINEMKIFLKHKVIENVENINKEEEKIDLELLKKVVDILDNEMIKEWQDVKDKGDFSLIEIFSKKIEEISFEYNIHLLKDFSLELLKNLEAFDVEKVDLLMEKFPSIVLNLRNKIKNG